MTNQTYQFQPYDVIQSLNGGTGRAAPEWQDFSTIRTPLDADQAERLVDSGTWDGKPLAFRITRRLPVAGQGIQTVVVYERTIATKHGRMTASHAEHLDKLDTLTKRFDAYDISRMGFGDGGVDAAQLTPAPTLPPTPPDELYSSLTASHPDFARELFAKLTGPEHQALVEYVSDNADCDLDAAALHLDKRFGKTRTQTKTTIIAPDGSKWTVVATIVNAELHVSLYDADNSTTTHATKYVRMARKGYADDDTGDTGGR